MILGKIDKLIRFTMNSGISNADFCKFLALETFAHLRPTSFYAAKITDDGCISPLGSFGVSAHVISRWGSITLSDDVPFADAVKSDTLILLNSGKSLKEYPNFVIHDETPRKWDSFLVCPVVPHGIISLMLDSTPKLDQHLELFLRTVGSIVMQHFNSGQYKLSKDDHRCDNKHVKKSEVLTNRQVSIMHLIEKGLTNPEIAEQIGYSQSLVRQETMAIYSRLNVSGRKELIERESNK